MGILFPVVLYGAFQALWSMNDDAGQLDRLRSC